MSPRRTPGRQITTGWSAPKTPIIEWIRAAHPHTTYTTSVCTGALLLGAAGLLEGLHATTHWAYYDALGRHGATPTEDRVVDEGKILTAAGVSAGIDLALTLVARMAGQETAQAFQLGRLAGRCPAKELTRADDPDRSAACDGS